MINEPTKYRQNVYFTAQAQEALAYLRAHPPKRDADGPISDSWLICRALIAFAKQCGFKRDGGK